MTGELDNYVLFRRVEHILFRKNCIYNILRGILKLNLYMLITITRTTSPNKRLDIIILLPITVSLKQKNNGD